MRFLAFFAAAFALSVPMVSFAQKTPKFPVEKYTLENGLQVVLSQDKTLPIVGVVVAYHVGSRNEVKTRTGFAHLFEHLMFQGSANVPKAGHFKFIENAGGEFQGTTRSEITTYEDQVPAEKLPLALWLEADRMKSLAVNATNFKNQKDVVKEEKRLRLDNVAYALANAKLQSLSYTNFSNQHLPIGSMEDLDAVDLAYVQSFYKAYYKPNNAVLVVTGDFDIPVVKDLIIKHFGSIAKGEDPPKTDTTEPAQVKQRSATVTDPFATVPGIFMAWEAPGIKSPDMEPTELLMQMVFAQDAKRAAAEIGAGENWILSISAGLDAQTGPSRALLSLIHRPDVKRKTLVDEVFVQLDRVKEELPSKEEVENVKREFLAAKYRSDVEPLVQRALGLAEYSLQYGDPSEYYKSFERYAAVTPEQIQAVAKKYFKKESSSILYVRGKDQKEEDEE
ncbi:MAG: insulinase family protein [Chthonomonadaceae bacterium]|nr:insulinase family protein [Chthonomonadaceae bacterium]